MTIEATLAKPPACLKNEKHRAQRGSAGIHPSESPRPGGNPSGGNLQERLAVGNPGRLKGVTDGLDPQEGTDRRPQQLQADLPSAKIYKIFSGILCSRITSIASDLAWLSAEQKLRLSFSSPFCIKRPY